MPGSCEFDELMNAHLDGETSPEEEKALSSHLQSCAECPLSLNEFKRLKLLVKTLSVVPAPASLRRRIFEKISLKTVVPFHIGIGRAAAAALTAFFLFIGSITVIGYFSPEPNAAVESNVYLSNRAYHMVSQPFADHSGWSYIAGDSDFELYNNAAGGPN